MSVLGQRLIDSWESNVPIEDFAGNGCLILCIFTIGDELRIARKNKVQ